MGQVKSEDQKVVKPNMQAVNLDLELLVICNQVVPVLSRLKLCFSTQRIFQNIFFITNLSVDICFFSAPSLVY